jgi:hypothetical protein
MQRLSTVRYFWNTSSLASRWLVTDLLVAAETCLVKPLTSDILIIWFQYSGFQAARHNIHHRENLQCHVRVEIFNRIFYTEYADRTFLRNVCISPLKRGDLDVQLHANVEPPSQRSPGGNNRCLLGAPSYSGNTMSGQKVAYSLFFECWSWYRQIPLCFKG